MCEALVIKDDTTMLDNGDRKLKTELGKFVELQKEYVDIKLKVEEALGKESGLLTTEKAVEMFENEIISESEEYKEDIYNKYSVDIEIEGKIGPAIVIGNMYYLRQQLLLLGVSSQRMLGIAEDRLQFENKSLIDIDGDVGGFDGVEEVQCIDGEFDPSDSTVDHIFSFSEHRNLGKVSNMELEDTVRYRDLLQERVEINDKK